MNRELRKEDVCTEGAGRKVCVASMCVEEYECKGERREGIQKCVGI